MVSKSHVFVYFSLLNAIIWAKHVRSELMAKEPRNNPTYNSSEKQAKSGENKKRLDQVPNSKNPKVPGNEAPYK